jgi:hypothetical protein
LALYHLGATLRDLLLAAVLGLHLFPGVLRRALNQLWLVGVGDHLDLSFFELSRVDLDLVEHADQVLNSVRTLLQTTHQVGYESKAVSLETF